MPETPYALSRSHYPVFFIDSRFVKQIGFGWVPATIANGQRSSSATSYVGPSYINRPNLHILLHAQATRLLEAPGLSTTTPTFSGVEFGIDSCSKSKTQSRVRSRLRGIRSKMAGGRPQRGHSERGSL